MVVDANPVGLGAILAQKGPGTDQVKVVSFMPAEALWAHRLVILQPRKRPSQSFWRM